MSGLADKIFPVNEDPDLKCERNSDIQIKCGGLGGLDIWVLSINFPISNNSWPLTEYQYLENLGV